MFNYLSCLEGKRSLIDIHCIAKNDALFVDLLWNIFCSTVVFRLCTIDIQQDASLSSILLFFLSYTEIFIQ